MFEPDDECKLENRRIGQNQPYHPEGGQRIIFLHHLLVLNFKWRAKAKTTSIVKRNMDLVAQAIFSLWFGTLNLSS